MHFLRGIVSREAKMEDKGYDTRQFSQMRILKGLRASRFVNADSKRVAVTGFWSRDGKARRELAKSIGERF